MQPGNFHKEKDKYIEIPDFQILQVLIQLLGIPVSGLSNILGKGFLSGLCLPSKQHLLPKLHQFEAVHKAKQISLRFAVTSKFSSRI